MRLSSYHRLEITIDFWLSYDSRHEHSATKDYSGMKITPSVKSINLPIPILQSSIGTFIFLLTYKSCSALSVLMWLVGPTFRIKHAAFKEFKFQNELWSMEVSQAVFMWH
jgi:hypothetical protein